VDIKREQVTQYDLRPLFGLDLEQARRRVFEFEESAAFADVAATTGAQEALRTLQRYYTLNVVTGRRQSIGDLTRMQLERHYEGVFRSVYHAHGGGNSVTSVDGIPSKAQVCRAIGARVLIDDLLEHAEACAKEGITVLLMDAPWNQLPDGKKLPFLVNRVYGWPDVVKRLVVPQLATQW
jgi:uncharacterized HAD superfamily protein